MESDVQDRKQEWGVNVNRSRYRWIADRFPAAGGDLVVAQEQGREPSGPQAVTKRHTSVSGRRTRLLTSATIAAMTLPGVDLPEESREKLKLIIDRYTTLGWTAITFHRPSASTHQGPRIELSATNPSGVRLRGGFDEDEHLVEQVASFFEK
jgi:hypothetical protein